MVQTSQRVVTAPVKAASAAVGFLIVMEFGSGLLQGWFSPLFTTIGQSYGASAASLNWVSAIYLLATVLCVPLLAKLGDMFGHKRLLVIATIAVALGSYLVAFAPNFELLLVGRVVQAPLAAFLPLEFAIVHQRNPGTAGRSIGRLVGALTLGVVVGGLCAGLILDLVGSLTLTMLVPAVFMTICVPVVILLVPETSIRKQGRVDWAGASLLGIGLLAVLGGVSNGTTWGWNSPLTLTAIIGGAVLLVLWVVVEKRVKTPLVDLDMLLRGGIGLPIIIAFLYGAQGFGSQTPSSLFLRADPTVYGYGLGVSAATAGLILGIYAFAAFVGATASDRLARFFGGPMVIFAAGILSGVAYLLMVFAPGTTVVFSTWLVLAGLGSGVVIGALPTLIVKRVEPDSVGIASALYNTARTAAGAVAGAIFALVMSSLLSTATVKGVSTPVSSLFSYQLVWAICAAICVVFAVLALFLRRQPAAVHLPTFVPSPSLAKEAA